MSVSINTFSLHTITTIVDRKSCIYEWNSIPVPKLYLSAKKQLSVVKQVAFYNTNKKALITTMAGWVAKGGFRQKGGLGAKWRLLPYKTIWQPVDFACEYLCARSPGIGVRWKTQEIPTI